MNFRSTVAEDLIRKADIERQRKNLDILTISIITNQLTLFYNSQLRIGRSELYNDTLDKYGKPYIKVLEELEEKEYEVLIDKGEEVVTKRTKDIQDGIEYLQQYGWANFDVINKFSRALAKEPVKVMALIDKILENG